MQRPSGKFTQWFSGSLWQCLKGIGDPQQKMTTFSQTQTSATVPLNLGVLDRRCQILKVVIVRRLITWVLGIWRGEGLGKGLEKGRSVYKQPETEVDGSCHS